MKTRMITSFPTRNSFPKVETSIYNRIFAIAEKHTCIIALPTLYTWYEQRIDISAPFHQQWIWADGLVRRFVWQGVGTVEEVIQVEDSRKRLHR